MKKNYKIVFFGTDDFSTIVLDELIDAGFEPALIVAAPDAPKGRKLVRTPPPSKTWADEHGIDVVQPQSPTDPSFLAEIKSTDWDLFLVASYGYILPQAILDIPRHGVLNVHPSLLPKFRGASPVQSAILADEEQTGVTVMLVGKKMDSGPIVAQASIAPDPWPPKAGMLKMLLAHEGGKLLAEVIPAWIEGSITPESQDDTLATYTKKVAKEDGHLDLAGDPYKNFLTIQALSENPGTYFFTKISGKDIRVKVTDAEYKDGRLSITRVVPEGKKEMSYEDFLRGNV